MTSSVRPEVFADGTWAELGWSDPAAGDVYEIARLAGACSLEADLTARVSSGLSALGGAGSGWEGEAAAEFHGRLGKLTPHLDRVHDSFDAAATALTGYAAALPGLKDRAARLLPQALEADRRRQVADPWSSQTLSPTGGPQAHQAIADLQALRREYEEIVHDHAGAVSRCKNGLDHAAKLGMHNGTLSWMRRHLHDDADKVGKVTSFVAEVSLVGGLVFPPAAPVLEIVAAGSSILTLAADATKVGTDTAFGGPVGKDALGLGLDALFVGKTLQSRDAMNAGQWRAFKSSQAAAEADRQYEQALAAGRFDIADEMAQRKAQLDAETQEALEEVERIDARDKEAELARMGAEKGGEIGEKLSGGDDDEKKDPR